MRRWLDSARVVVGLSIAVPAAAATWSEPPACEAGDIRAICVAARAFEAVDALPADERATVVASVLANHVVQRVTPPPKLLAAARRLGGAGTPSERLQVMPVLAEFDLQGPDPTAGRRAVDTVDKALAGLARAASARNALQIADVCIGLTEIHDGAPVLVPAWARLYQRHCKPAVLTRIKGRDGFSRLTRDYLKLVGDYLIADHAAFAAGLPQAHLALQALARTLAAEDSGVDDTPRDAGRIVAEAMNATLGTLACLSAMREACVAILRDSLLAENYPDPEFWSSWAAIVAVRGEGFAAAGRSDEAGAAFEWLLARAAEPERASHRAVFLASAAWLAERLERRRGAPRALQST